MLRPARLGFTLVELLVVISIVVTLMALLAPALDRAIYQAQLTSCSARLHGHAQGVTTYAFDAKRYFPDRKALTGSHPWLNTLRGRDPNANWIDDRTMIFPYVQPAFFLDPLCSEKIDLENAEALTSFVSSTYLPFYGYRYTAPGSKGPVRYGTGFTWDDDPYQVLVADQDWSTGIQTVGSHPDRQPEAMTLFEWQNQPLLPGTEGIALSAAGGYNVVMARWAEPRNAMTRGVIDSNHAIQDGAVLRYTDVPRDAERSDYGRAMGKVGMAFNSPRIDTQPFNGNWFQVPAQ